jgi:MFS transporter, SP family, inositol transporter
MRMEGRPMTETTEHLPTPGGSTREDWKNTILAGLANYIDAGSIVASSVALAMWVEVYHLSNAFVGLIGAFSANAISAGVGAFVGGRLCDKLGRKKIYQWDMLFYAFGMLFLIFAVHPWMILVGSVVVGLAVGADIPASWTIIAEMAPDGHRGKHSGVAQVLWYMGPVVVLVAALALAPLGVLGARIIFGHLFLIALLLWAFRFGMKESTVWSTAKQVAIDHDPNAPKVNELEVEVAMSHGHLRELFTGDNLKAMAFLIGMYGIWNLWAGTNGFFFPYILRTVGSQSQAVSVALQASYFFLGVISIALIFMRYSDRFDQRKMLAVSFIGQIIGMSLLALFPLTLPVAIAYLVLTGLFGGFGAQSFFQLWSGELFPTLLRSTAQGLMFAVVRIGLGIWSFFVPVLTAAAGFKSLAWILTGFLVVAGIIGWLGAPRNEGKSLEEIQFERHHIAPPRVAPGSSVA